MFYSLLADLIVAIHVGYVSFVVVGQAAIVLGLVFGWRWTRNPWFRWLQLLAMSVVVVETVAGWPCPLTLWEADLRDLAGQAHADGTFIGRMLHGILFRDEWPEWVFPVVYMGFGAMVLLTFVLAPPRRRRAGPAAGQPQLTP